MTPLAIDLLRVVLIGVGATAVMDAWTLLLQRLGVPTLKMALIGRWVGHLFRGRWRHESIARAAPIPAEGAIGWFTHYVVGIAFAGLLAAAFGLEWMRRPSPWPALAVGIATVLAPFLVMQPAMGAGIAASRTPTPGLNRLRSLATHTVFGAGLYASAWLLARVAP